MTKHLTARAALIAVAIMGGSIAWAERSNTAVSFRVEKGDTFTNLFGPDWQKGYQQNEATVMRHGKPVTSPDILIEGSIISVSGDVRLTPRASARITALNLRRNELQARLTELAPKLAALPAAQTAAAECRRILDNDVSFAADLDFVAREIAHLNQMAQNQGAPAPAQHSTPSVHVWWIAAFALVGIVLAVAILWLRNRPAYPEGVVRYREAIADVKASFNEAGVPL